MIDLAHINEKGFWDTAGITAAPLVVTHAGVHSLCPSTRNLTDKQLDARGGIAQGQSFAHAAGSTGDKNGLGVGEHGIYSVKSDDNNTLSLRVWLTRP